ncbi:hypothetical protein [Acinetobacter phage Ab69]|nr:hypothetical protein [Acinetobacter phage Ab69]
MIWALALKTALLPAEQSHIVSRIHAVNERQVKQLTVNFKAATDTVMHLWQFLGDVESDIYVNDGGFKKKWLGFNHELEAYLKEVGNGEFVVKTNHCCLTCFSTFKSFYDEMNLSQLS